PDLQVLDVREESEWRTGRIPGSMHVPYHDLDELPAGLDPDRAVAVICGSGQRSAVGASLVQRLGWSRCSTWSTAASVRGPGPGTRSRSRIGRATAVEGSSRMESSAPARVLVVAAKTAATPALI